MTNYKSAVPLVIGFLLLPACKPRRIASQAAGDESTTKLSAVLPDPDRPGSPKPNGRSIFDLAMNYDGKFTLPYDETSTIAPLIKRVEEATGAPMVRVLIPGSRSLQRLNSTYLYPRIVFAAQNPKDMSQTDRPLLFAEGLLFIGYSEWAKEIEVLSWNNDAARFEFQLIHDYREKDRTPFYASRDVCAQCHQNHGPIFSDRTWSESTAADNMGKLVAKARGNELPYHGAAIRQFQLRDSTRYDELTRLGNRELISQVLWQHLCGDGSAGNTCRSEIVAGALAELCLSNKTISTQVEQKLTMMWTDKQFGEVIMRGSILRDREPLNMLPKALPVAELPPEAGERPPVRVIPKDWDPETRGVKGRELEITSYSDISRVSARPLSTIPLTAWVATRLQPYKKSLCANVKKDDNLKEILAKAPNPMATTLAAPSFYPERIVWAWNQMNKSTPPRMLSLENKGPEGEAQIEEVTLPQASDPVVGLFVTYCARCHQNREPLIRFPETKLVENLRVKWRKEIYQRLDWIASRAARDPVSSAMPRPRSDEYNSLMRNENDGLQDHQKMLEYVAPPK